MAEVSTNVYDILFPSPPALQDIVAISIALRLWRQEINTHRIKNTLNKLNLRAKIISSDSVRGIPSSILSTIEKYVKRVGVSIKHWLDDHSYPILFDVKIFNDFIDFVADFDGSIHYVRTAKRFVKCDKIDKCVRFRIACKYCFEDDIQRIWPSVSSRDGLKSSFVLKYGAPELKYWIFQLKNQLYMLPRSLSYGQSIEEEIFCKAHQHWGISNTYSSWSCIEYFWNRFDSDTRLRVIAHQKVQMHKPYRYLLGKLNDVELEKFANTKACRVINDLMIVEPNLYYARSCDSSYFKDDFRDRVPFIIAIWAYIKKHMNSRTFFSLVRIIILEGARAASSLPICRELWNTAPEHLKANAIQQLLGENSLESYFELYSMKATHIDVSFLLTVLSDASAENRRTFWGRHWRRLIDLTLANDYDKLMRFCFNNDENEIVKFKRNSLTALPSVRVKCVKLLNNLSLEELNKFLRFCYPDERTRRSIQLNLLVEEFKVDVENITKVSPSLNDFINDTYNDVNLANDFKTQLLYSPSVKEKFTELVISYSHEGKFQREANFIDALAPSQQVARDLKKIFFIPLLHQKLIAGTFKSKIDENEFSNFISGCASSEDEIAQLKANLPVDEMVQILIRNVANKADGPAYHSFLVNFLEWYFITAPELKEFKARYAQDDVFMKLITKSR